MTSHNELCTKKQLGWSSAYIQNPVHWAYGLKHIRGQQYEVHLQATIDDGWHIYAQQQPQGAVAVPARIIFTKMTGLTLSGLPAEIGKKESYTVKEAGITNYEYTAKVDFVQSLTIATGIKEIKGTITYQACTHQKCLSPETLNFTVPVN
jgi:DsbC/DsbD-like thiol-disulfide interchange protein